MKILVTGATGYIGGRLVPRLLARGHKVRIFVRDPRRIAGRPWLGQVEIATGNIQNYTAVSRALEGMDTAYYLVHSMEAGPDYALLDRMAANLFAAAAKNIRHLIYLGGLLPPDGTASEHLTSRAEVGEILRAACPTTEFRAGPIIGSGSASFEMVRYLTERLPILIFPRWIDNVVQPIAIRNILSYLIEALEKGPLGIVNLGAEVLSFMQMFKVYAKCRGQNRVFIRLPPLLKPDIFAWWVAQVTPIPKTIAKPLLQGINRHVTADISRAKKLFPGIEPFSYRKAVELALERIQKDAVETRWSGALREGNLYELSDEKGLMREIRTIFVELPPEKVFRSFSSIGGNRGWRTWEWAWGIRGLIDKLLGGPGLRRGRRHPTEIMPGEALDFWRVDDVVEPYILRLRAEMKVPGKAWLQWEAVPEGSGTRLVQTAMFAPTGFLGTFYWYSLYPIHQCVFSDLVKVIAEDAARMPDIGSNSDTS